jgi:hypothetical protein
MAKYLSKAGQSVVAGLNGDLDPEFLKVNKQFGGLLTIDPCMQATVTGAHFFVYASTSLGSTDAAKTYLVETPDTTKWAHMVFDMDGSAITQFDIYEDSGYDATTDKYLTAYNANRNSTDAAGVVVSEDPTTDATIGTLLTTYKGGAATNQSRSATGKDISRAMVLKQNSKYLISIDSGTDANLINFDIHWYEVTYSS